MSKKNTENTNKEIFKKGSTTYYNSSIFFPKEVREKVETFYAFVRTADDLVDEQPPREKEYVEYKRAYVTELREGSITEEQTEIIKKFIVLRDEIGIEQSWIEAFFKSMEMDLNEKQYITYEDVKRYIFGSAEVIGLVMCKILNISDKAYLYAQKMGESMQFINMIRDIDEDLKLGRVYMPKEDLAMYNLTDLSPESDRGKFREFIRFEIERYEEVQKMAEIGFKYIPYRYLVPIKTASDLYKYTARMISENPDIIFEKKVKPSKRLVYVTIFKNFISLSPKIFRKV